MESKQPAHPFARTAALVAVGCKVNQSELRQWGAALEAAGVTIVPSGSPADLTIVNTCTVTSDGDKTSRKAIRHVIRQTRADGASRFVVATGCSASVDPEAVAAIDGVDLIVPNADKDDLIRRLADIGVVPPLPAQPDRWTHPSERPGWITLLPALERRARAFVKVQDGCNSHCTYCIVPRARGPQRSRPIDAIVNEIRVLYHLGYREAVLTGVQIGAYGSDWDASTRRVTRGRGPTLTNLVERVLTETSMPRIRISSIQPQDWPAGFLDLWRDGRMCRHLHLPLQSGSDSVLRRMVRRYRASDFYRLVEELRGLMPEVAITADLMIGFPGETDTEHRDSLALVRKLAFAEQHVFRYSARPGTAAARLPDDVPPPVKKRRSDEARALDAELRTAYRQRFLGQTLDVLWEEHAHLPGCEPGMHPAVWSGLTDNYLRVFAPGDALEGTITPVRLLDLSGDGIRGEIA
ncbi:MAG: MiaB/RimO family radical SAM methylthiotransferase [Chloroflexi bacterium]|nr:MiaB/RimO family radical SAM methylthiotransferase [Chloroflexota bacterium]